MRMQHQTPESRDKWRQAMAPTWQNSPLKGRANPQASERMMQNNPMQNPEAREKVSRTLKAIGHRPKARGGNGKLTEPQVLLAELTGLTAELVVKTRPIRGKIERLPTNYKIDLACQASMLAVELDGSSHRSPAARDRDAKKERALSLLGWRVLRFSNREAMENTRSVVDAIRSSMTSR